MRNTSITDGAIEPGQHPRASFRAPQGSSVGQQMRTSEEGGPLHDVERRKESGGDQPITLDGARVVPRRPRRPPGDEVGRR